MTYKQFQVGHSIKFLIVSFHSIESEWLPNRILIPYGRKLEIELDCKSELRKEAGKELWELCMRVSYKTRIYYIKF